MGDAVTVDESQKAKYFPSVSDYSLLMMRPNTKYLCDVSDTF